MFGKKKNKTDRADMFLGNLERESAERRREAPAPEEPRREAPAPTQSAPPRSVPRRRPVRDLPSTRDRADGGQMADGAEPLIPEETTAAHPAPAEGKAEAGSPAAESAPEAKPAPEAKSAPEAKPAVDIFADEVADETGDPAHPFGATAFEDSFREQAAKTARHRRARREPRREESKTASAPSRSGKLREYIRGTRDERPKPPAENGVAAELQELYAPEEAGAGKKGRRKLTPMDWVRYLILFLCIFGFLVAGYFVINKLYDYYRGSALYSSLADLVTQRDRFADQYLARSLPQASALTIADVYNGKSAGLGFGGTAASDEEQELIAKIARLKEINPDTLGWISIDNTVVNYPVMWTKTRNYYLHRDFYGKTLGAGAIYMDERNSTNIAENRNTVIYGHNMADGSMFASLHDFTSASVFYNAAIRLATSDGIFVYKPFSVHRSDAYDNYFETDFASDRIFEEFIANMASISMFESEREVNRSSQILTLSTCQSSTVSNNDRFVVQAVLIDVIR